MKFKPSVVPNAKSIRKTPASLNIDLHYAELNIVRRWNWERFHRLAAFLNVTYEELASLICLPHTQLPGIKKRNFFPGPAALLLTLIEAQAMIEYSQDIIAQPFPTQYASPRDTEPLRPDQ